MNQNSYNGKICLITIEKLSIIWCLFIFFVKNDYNSIFFSYLWGIKNLKQMTNRDLNRIKVVLAEKKRTNKWLAEQLGKDQGTISKWCTNTCQPDLGNLMKISELLEVDLNELVRFKALKECDSSC